MTRLVLVGGLTALATAVVTSAQVTRRDDPSRVAAGVAVISGRVVTADDARRPIRRAVAQLMSSLSDRRLAVTDDEGRFEFQQLPAGRYTLVVSKAAYATSYFGARRPHRPPGASIVLADAERRADIVVPLMRGAVIAGTVRAASGQPVPNARLAVLTYQTLNGRRTLGPAAGSGTTVDDRGEYRMYGLPPGTYVVAVAPPFTAQSARPTSAAEVRWAQQLASQPTAEIGSAPVPPAQAPVMPLPVYYPGTPDADTATTIEVGPGEERTGIDLVLQYVVAARLEGVVQHPDGRLAANTGVFLARPGTTFFLESPMTLTRTDASGRFVAAALRPGRYSIFVTASSAPGGPPATPSGAGRGGTTPPADLWASETVEVSGRDIEGIRLVLQRGMTLAGRVDFDASERPAPEPARVRLNLTARARDGQPQLGVPFQTLGPNGAFEFRGIAPGTYELTATVSGGTPQEWTARSALWNGANLLEPFEIVPGDDRADVVVTITDRVTELSGTIFDTRGQPAPDYSVLVFPVDRTQWVYPSRRIRSVRPATNAEFRLLAMPPGEYFVAVLVDTNDVDLGDTSFLEEVAAASIRVRLVEGERTRQDVRLSGG